MTFEKFYELLHEIIDDDIKFARAVYARALRRRSTTALNYINYLQRNEPHYKNANFNR
jgi:hypothetical protein